MKARNKLLKKLIIVLLIISNIVIFGGDLEQYLQIFDTDSLINQENNKLNTLGLYLKFLETSNEEYKNTANLLRARIYNDFSADESAVLNILSETLPNQINIPEKKLYELSKLYKDSVIINAFYIEFAYKSLTEEYNATKEKLIMESIEKIEKLNGESPFTVYYKSIIQWYSKINSNPSKAYENLEKMYNNNRDNIKLSQLIVRLSYESQRYDKIEELYSVYTTLNKKDEKTMILFAKAFQEMEKESITRNILEWLINNSNKKSILSSTYEILGDISSTSTQKINNYKKSLEYDEKNPNSLGKIGMEYYKTSKDKLISRLYLQKALYYKNNDPEIIKLLKEIDKETKITGLFSYIIPLSLFVIIFGILLLNINKFKKNKRKDEENNDAGESEKNNQNT
jgi:tetratricopeptide (TPR) repeat protein